MSETIWDRFWLSFARMRGASLPTQKAPTELADPEPSRDEAMQRDKDWGFVIRDWLGMGG